MKPVNIGGHAAYQNRVLEQLRKYYPDAVHSLPASTWEIIEKFWALDLSDVDSIMQDRYSDFGPAPRLPSDMLRSILPLWSLKSLPIQNGLLTSKKTRSMPSFPALPLVTLPEQALFMIFRTTFGFPMITISRPKPILQRISLTSLKKRKESTACRKAHCQGTLQKI